MVKILIIEDDYIWQTKIEVMISSFPQFEIIGFAECVSKAQDIIKNYTPDIIISDLFLGRDNVLLFMESVFAVYPTLFLSSYQDEAFFKTIVNFPSSAFLIKPFHDFSLLSSLLNLVKNFTKLNEDLKFLSFRGLKSGMVKVKFANIVKIEVEGNYSICFTSDGKKYARKVSLNSVLKILDDRFLRVSKTIAVNVRYISKVDYFDKILYLNNEAYHIGRPYLKKLKDFNYIY